MKLDLNKFYNSNYKDFVHKEALEDALRMVAEIDLKEVEIDTILSVTFSVDEFGENPMYVEYLDKDGKKHIVRIKPAVNNEIQEMLKRYVTLEQHETDKQDIYNHFEHMHVPMEIRSENGLDEDGNKFIVLNNDNSYLSIQVDPETDDEIQWLCIHNKGGLGSQSMYFARFMDYAKVDQVPSNTDFLEKIHQLEELIQRKSQETLQNSKEYTDTQDNTLRTEITTNVTNQINETKNDILSYVDVEVDNLKDYVDNRDAEYHELSKRYTDNAKQEAVNSSKTYTDNKTAETLETSKTYTDTKHTEATHSVIELENDMNTNFATKQELTVNVAGLSEYINNSVQSLNDRIDTKATVYTTTEGHNAAFYHDTVTFEKLLNGDITFKPDGRTAPTYGYLLNEPQLTKLKNLNEAPPGNTCDIKYNSNEDATEINFLPGDPNRVTIATADGIKMNSSFITDKQATDIRNNTHKLSEVYGNGVVPNIVWYPDGRIDYLRLLHYDEYVKTHIKDSSAPSDETIVYLPTFMAAEKSELSKLNDKIKMIETMISTIGETTPIEMTIEYNGNSLELNNYSTCTTIGDTTIVNINCNFTAPFNSGSVPILNTLNISSETLKTFPTFMIDCIVKTATNVSSYNTTTTFSNKITDLYVETPVIASNETIATTLISFNGSFIFNNTSKESEE